MPAGLHLIAWRQIRSGRPSMPADQLRVVSIRTAQQQPGRKCAAHIPERPAMTAPVPGAAQ